MVVHFLLGVRRHWRIVTHVVSFVSRVLFDLDVGSVELAILHFAGCKDVRGGPARAFVLQETEFFFNVDFRSLVSPDINVRYWVVV